MSIFSKFSQGLKKTKDSLFGDLASMFRGRKIDDETFEELEELLITSDVGVNASMEICESLQKAVREKRIEGYDAVMAELHDIILHILEDETESTQMVKPHIVLVIGVNGVGKTTTIGKLAAHYKAQGKSVMLAAADTFRAAAIEQLEIWAQRAQVDIVKQHSGADPAAVIHDAIVSAKAKGVDVLLCDTAGRLHNKKNLMDELGKIYKVIGNVAPDSTSEVLLVLDAATGQNCLSQAKQFSEVTDVSGIALTKLDGTAKGGIVIALKREMGLPIKYVGCGEKIDDLELFDAKVFTDALFDREVSA